LKTASAPTIAPTLDLPQGAIPAAIPPATAEAAPLPFRPGRRLAERLAALGRTEDLQFSPDQKRLAICCFSANRILVLSLAVVRGPGGARGVAAEAFVELACAGFHHPHGLCWLDDATLAVANRKGGLQVVAVPPAAAADGAAVQATPLFALPGDGTHGVKTPGSVAVARRGRRRFDLYVCNNYVHSLARLSLRRERVGGGFTLLESRVLPARGLDIPDGVALGAGRRLAISNHNRHRVDLFRRSLWTGLEKRPVAILQVPGYPHGLRFAAGGRALVVADAAAPLVHVFAPLPRGKGPGGARLLQPRASLRVMDDATFLRGQNNPQDGGPKGLDILEDGSLFALTCEETPLQFFDGAALGLRLVAR
jgi:hypothetical protein